MFIALNMAFLFLSSIPSIFKKRSMPPNPKLNQGKAWEDGRKTKETLMNISALE